MYQQGFDSLAAAGHGIRNFSLIMCVCVVCVCVCVCVCERTVTVSLASHVVILGE
jgi:hypothetical protein